MDNTCDAAEKLKDLLLNYTDTEAKIAAIEDLEHKCDINVHTLLKHLNRSFITPIDREDIYLIAKEMDDIVDHIESSAYRFKLFNIKEIRPAAMEMTDMIVNCTKELKVVVDEMRYMKTSKILHEKIIEVNRIENQGDDVYREAIHNLFLNETDPMEVIKWKEIYEYMEKTVDACEDVANVIEGIVTKHV
ncbi:MAG: DUF47 family protein [Clostridia bacterium]|nr:DUF47 family protein [Clostridia bacterium]